MPTVRFSLRGLLATVNSRTSFPRVLHTVATMSWPAPPCSVGQHLLQCDTPAAVVDLDALAFNIAAAGRLIAAAGPSVKIRAHMKSHKTPELVALQAKLHGEATFIGICAQKVCEAEAAETALINDILLSNQVVCEAKLRRLLAVAGKVAARGGRVSLLVDNADNVKDIAALVQELQAPLTLLVEVDVGQARCGVSTAEEAVELGKQIVGAGVPLLQFGGIQCYHGAAQHVRSYSERRAIIEKVSAKAKAVKEALLAAGLPCPIVTGGGTGTFWFEAASGVFTEVQPGSYILGDADYARNLDEEGKEIWNAPFQPCLFLLSQVMSVHKAKPAAGASRLPASSAFSSAVHSSSASSSGPEWAVIDSGLKAQSTDSGLPVIVASVEEYCRRAAERKEATESQAAGAQKEVAAAAAAAAAATGTALEGPVIPWDHSRGCFASSAGSLILKSVSDEHSTIIPRPAGADGGAGSSAATASSSSFVSSSSSQPLPSLKDKLLLMPGHCDPFMNHYDYLVGFRPSSGTVEGVWRVAARSPGS